MGAIAIYLCIITASGILSKLATKLDD